MVLFAELGEKMISRGTAMNFWVKISKIIKIVTF